MPNISLRSRNDLHQAFGFGFQLPKPCSHRVVSAVLHCCVAARADPRPFATDSIDDPCFCGVTTSSIPPANPVFKVLRAHNSFPTLEPITWRYNLETRYRLPTAFLVLKLDIPALRSSQGWALNPSPLYSNGLLQNGGSILLRDEAAKATTPGP